MRVLAAVVAVVAAVAVEGLFGGLLCFHRAAQLCWELAKLSWPSKHNRQGRQQQAG
jgi:hypothetical protein